MAVWRGLAPPIGEGWRHPPPAPHVLLRRRTLRPSAQGDGLRRTVGSAPSTAA